MVLPDVRAWDEPAAAWMERAADGEAAEGAGGARERAEVGRVTLGNLARSRPAEGDVRVDRTSGAALANPFEMARGRGRAEVCQACDEVVGEAAEGAVARAAQRRGWAMEPQWHAADTAEAAEGRRQAIEACARRVAAGYDVRLMCWCYPRQCHAEGLAVRVMGRARALQAEARGKRRR